MNDLDLDTIRHALRTARENGYEVVRVRSGASSFRGVLDLNEAEHHTPELVMMPDEVDQESQEPEVASVQSIKAAQVGYFSPAGTFVVGALVTKGDAVGTIRALGISNDVLAKVGGRVTEILVAEGDAVEFGQELARVEA